MLPRLRETLGQHQGRAVIIVVNPPAVQGLGAAGGFKLMLEDRGELGPQALAKAANDLAAAANKDPAFAGVFTLYNAGSPSVYADIDRQKVCMVGLAHPTDVFSTLQPVPSVLQYVNDFNYLGRTYQVVAQGDEAFRRTPEDISRLRVRNVSGEMVPVGAVATFKNKTSPYRVPRYNLYPAAEVMGSGGPRHRLGHCCWSVWKSSPRRCFCPALHLNGPISLTSRSSTASRTVAIFAAASALFCLPRARRSVRELEDAAGDRADCAHVHAQARALSSRPPHPEHADRHLGPDRLRAALGLAAKKRDPDRRVRETAAGRGRRRGRGGGGTRGPDAAWPILDDLFRVHRRRGAPLAVATRAGSEMHARSARDRGVLRDARGDRLRTSCSRPRFTPSSVNSAGGNKHESPSTPATAESSAMTDFARVLLAHISGPPLQSRGRWS